MPKLRLRKMNTRRQRAMLWSVVLIVASAMALPLASYVVTGISDVQAQVRDDGTNQRANFWRAVRGGNEGYSAVPGPESNVLINGGGQNWRQLRNGYVANYGGWVLGWAVLIIALFYAFRGRIDLTERRSGKTVPRWTVAERFMHWYTAIGFIILAVTGLSMLFGRTVLIPMLGARGFSQWADLSISVHNVVGPFFSIGVLCMLIFWIKNNIPLPVDLVWFLKGGGMIGKAHPSAGKANGGEKVWYWIVILIGLVGVCLTGLVLIGWGAKLGLDWAILERTRENMQNLQIIHAGAAVIWIAVFLGHAYIGTIGSEGSLEAMTTGRVSVEWAEQHHDRWYEKVRDKAEVTESTGRETPAHATGATAHSAG